MHFLLNLSLLSPSLALYCDGKMIDFQTWEDLKSSSEKIWHWIENHKKELSSLKSVRSITGPGGFSSLRVAGLICETLIEKHGCELRTIRSDQVAKQVLTSLDISSPFVLNAFGNHIFLPQSPEQPLELVDLSEIKTRFPHPSLLIFSQR